MCLVRPSEHLTQKSHPNQLDRHFQQQQTVLTVPPPADASFNWRWGLADWARCGPSNASDVPVSADVGATAGGALDLRLSVLTALRRHQRDLEVELHSALMTAFLGPR